MCVPSTYIAYTQNAMTWDLQPLKIAMTGRANRMQLGKVLLGLVWPWRVQPDQTWGAAAAARERGRGPLNRATCLHNLTILTILKENTHNTHMLTIAQKLILTSSSSYYSLRGPVSSIWPLRSTGSSAAHRSYSSFCLASSSPYQEFHNSPSSPVSWGAGPILFILATALP